MSQFQIYATSTSLNQEVIQDAAEASKKPPVQDQVAAGRAAVDFAISLIDNKYLGVTDWIGFYRSAQ